MSDDEREYSEEEEEEEEERREVKQVKKPPAAHVEETVKKTEAEILLEEKMKKKMDVDEEQWHEYIDTWRKQRAKEEDDLKKLKDKQAKRKSQREAEEKKMAEQKRQQEEQRAKESEAKREKEMEEKRRRLEEAEKRRQAMLNKSAQPVEVVKPNFVIQKRTDGGPGASLGGSAMDKMMNVAAARGDMGKTKEQLQEDKNIALSFRIKPLEIEGLTVDKLKEKAKEMWEIIIKLETEKYDLEERQKRQEYDLKELNERQRQINRNKALKKGLDPESLSGKHPPKLQVASKYERRIDRRTYDDKKQLYNGGYESQVVTLCEKIWGDRLTQFEEKKGRLPKWLGEQPGKKPGDPEEEEEEKKDSHHDVAADEEEEEVEEEEDEEED